MCLLHAYEIHGDFDAAADVDAFDADVGLMAVAIVVAAGGFDANYIEAGSVDYFEDAVGVQTDEN